MSEELTATKRKMVIEQLQIAVPSNDAEICQKVQMFLRKCGWTYAAIYELVKVETGIGIAEWDALMAEDPEDELATIVAESERDRDSQ